MAKQVPATWASYELAIIARDRLIANERVVKVVVDGEALAVMHDLPPSIDRAVPFQIQPLESDHFDPSYNDISPEGNEIRFGIEWKGGRRYKYWLYDNHPGEVFLTSDNSRRVGVVLGDILHVFRLTKAGFGQGKNGYRLNYIRAKCQRTSEAWINCIFLVMNLMFLFKEVAKAFFSHSYIFIIQCFAALKETIQRSNDLVATGVAGQDTFF